MADAGPPPTVRSGGLARRLSLAALAAGILCSAGAALSRPLDKATASGTLSIVVYKDFAPWSFEENGELKGIDVDLARELGRELKLEPVLLQRAAGEDVDTDLRANIWRGDIITKARADVMMHVPTDPALAARNDMVVICCGYEHVRMAVAIDPSEITAKTYGTFRTHKIAVEGGETGDIWLSAAFNGLLAGNVVREKSFDAAAAKFAAGTVPALMAPRSQLEWATRSASHPVTIEEWPMFGILNSSWSIGLATRVDAHDLAYALEDALTTIRDDGRLTKIYASYGVTWQKPSE